MPHDMLGQMRIEPGHRTLGELLQERQWAVHEISRLRDEIVRLSTRHAMRVPETNSAPTRVGEEPMYLLAAHRFLRISDVKKLVALSGSTIYRLVGEGAFPAGVHFGPRTVRWRAKDILAWQNACTA